MIGEMMLNFLLFLIHSINPRSLLVLAVLIATFSVCVRNVSIEMLNLRGMPRKRSTFYGNFLGIATAFFTIPSSLTFMLPSST